MCGWLLHSKSFLIKFVHLSEAVMCPACLRGFDRWPPSRDIAAQCPAGQWMGSANQVPYSLAGNCARDFRRGVLVLAADLCTIISQVLLTHCFFSSQTEWGVYGSLRVRTTQTILAVLLAMATVATRAGLRSSNEVSHLLARSG
jgi:hypothetical protein